MTNEDDSRTSGATENSDQRGARSLSHIEETLADIRSQLEALRAENKPPTNVEEILLASPLYSLGKWVVIVFILLGVILWTGGTIYSGVQIMSIKDEAGRVTAEGQGFRDRVNKEIVSIKEEVKENLENDIVKTRARIIAEMETKIAAATTVEIDKMRAELSQTKTGLLKEMDEEIDKAANEAKRSVQTRVKILEKSLQETERRANSARDSFKAVVTYSKGKPQESQPGQERVTAANCEPLKLTKDQVSLINISQMVERSTSVKSKNNKIYYQNRFKISPIDENKDDVSKELRACIFDAVDRVEYELDPKWFTPSKAVRIEKSDAFGFTMNVWGSTPIKAAVFLRGAEEPIRFEGRFRSTEAFSDYMNRSIR